MKKLILILTGLILFFTTCKKENKTTPDPSLNPQGSNNSAADFTITPSNINYTIGSTWVYEVVTIDDYYTNGVLNPSQSITTTSTYTVTVSGDTIISPTIPGKIFHYDGPGLDGVNNYIRGVMFYDPLDNKCHEMIYQKINGSESSGCLGIDIPLTSSGKWQSNHSNHSSIANDSCFAIGYENISSGLGNIKCIKFHNKDQSTVFWYNNIYGKVKTANFSYQIINWAQTTTKTITNTLISFHQ